MNKIICECPVDVYEVNVDMLPSNVTLEMLEENDMDYMEYFQGDYFIGWIPYDTSEYTDELGEEFEIHPSENQWFEEEFGNCPDGTIIYVWVQNGELYHYKDGYVEYSCGRNHGGDLMMKVNGKFEFI